MRATIKNDKIVFDIKTKTQGIVFEKNTVNGETISATFVNAVKVTLVSKSIRDKVLYELNSDQYLSLVGSLIFNKKLENTDEVYVPFALGDLNLTDDDYLEVEISFTGTNDGDTVIYDRLISGEPASGPISVKHLTNVSEFDSAYYNALLTKDEVGFDYHNQKGDKSYIPKVFVKMARNLSQTTLINLQQNTTYTVSNDAKIMLVDY